MEQVLPPFFMKPPITSSCVFEMEHIKYLVLAGGNRGEVWEQLA